MVAVTVGQEHLLTGVEPGSTTSYGCKTTSHRHTLLYQKLTPRSSSRNWYVVFIGLSSTLSDPRSGTGSSSSAIDPLIASRVLLSVLLPTVCQCYVPLRTHHPFVMVPRAPFQQGTTVNSLRIRGREPPHSASHFLELTSYPFSGIRVASLSSALGRHQYETYHGNVYEMLWWAQVLKL